MAKACARRLIMPCHFGVPFREIPKLSWCLRGSTIGLNPALEGSVLSGGPTEAVKPLGEGLYYEGSFIAKGGFFITKKGKGSICYLFIILCDVNAPYG